MAQPVRASLDEIAATIPISALQSASIACEISGRLERWVRAKHPSTVVVPTLHDITITQSGSIWWWRGRAVAPADVVSAVGTLLVTMLQRTPVGRTPAGLLYVVARATEPGHLAPFRDLGEFHAALARYSAERRELAIDALLARYQIARSGLPPLGADSSISDIRRMRRAGGVPLTRVASDTGIPISLLRELEWGVYTNWNLAHASPILASYAERAGLDPDAVAQVIVREQALALPDSLNTPATDVTVHRQDALLPFAFAAILFVTLMAGAPDDRGAPAPSAARVVAQVPAALSTAADAREQTPTPTTRLVSTAAATRVPPRRVSSRAKSPGTRPSATISQRAGRQTPRDESTTRPLLRLARAIAGDGRYRAEPFPRPKE